MSEDRSQPPPRPRRLPWIWISIGIVLVVGLAVVVMLNAILQAKVEAEREAIRREGFPVTLAELDAWYPKPTGRNAAEVYAQAALAFKFDNATDNDLPILGGDSRIYEPGKEINDETRKPVGEFLKKNAECLRLLHEAAGIGECRYDVDLKAGFEALLPHLAKQKQTAQLLMSDALFHADAGRGKDACRAVLDSLAVARSFRREPVLISQLVRYAIIGIACTAQREVMTQIQFPRESLDELARELESAESPDALARGIAGEGCMGSDAFDRYTDASVLSWSGTPGNAGQRILFALYRHTPLQPSDHLEYLAVLRDFIDITRKPTPARMAAAEVIERHVRSIPTYRIYCQLLLPAWSKAFAADLKCTARIRSARLAAAVEQYRLVRGKLPDAAAELVPEFLKSIPEDPFDGKPLRYRRFHAATTTSPQPASSVQAGTEARPSAPEVPPTSTPPAATARPSPAQGYRIWSVGEDGTDDGGPDEDPDAADQPDETFTVER